MQPKTATEEMASREGDVLTKLAKDVEQLKDELETDKLALAQEYAGKLEKLTEELRFAISELFT